ncbi:hypothetical protein HYW55_00415 [Candidatus Gottesmanbacteria bacterium]|nr:hypothetical protein [Candidatus Gottesmanbacteria bacterium]
MLKKKSLIREILVADCPVCKEDFSLDCTNTAPSRGDYGLFFLYPPLNKRTPSEKFAELNEQLRTESPCKVIEVWEEKLEEHRKNCQGQITIQGLETKPS